MTASAYSPPSFLSAEVCIDDQCSGGMEASDDVLLPAVQHVAGREERALTVVGLGPGGMSSAGTTADHRRG